MPIAMQMPERNQNVLQLAHIGPYFHFVRRFDLAPFRARRNKTNTPRVNPGLCSLAPSGRRSPSLELRPKGMPRTGLQISAQGVQPWEPSK